MRPPVRVYLSPGMFGFASLAAYDYFGHVELGLRQRFRLKGDTAIVRVCEVHPTASIRRRASKLAAMLAHTAGTDGGPIHILGHSTGGLDARMVASPSVHLGDAADTQLGWLSRLRSVTMVNTPHYGTPLATFFATAKGQRMLYAVCAITVTALKLGAPPLAAASALIAALGQTRDTVGVELALIDRVTESLSRALDEASSRELRTWLREVQADQGGVVQLMPEAMDLFQAGVENRPGVLYQSVASYAPPRAGRQWLRAFRSPWLAVSAPLFHLMHRVTGDSDSRYPCAPVGGGHLAPLIEALGEAPPEDANDGVVPLSSQVWGELAWVGLGDHLDMVGHFDDQKGRHGHTDWLASGSAFDRERFDAMLDRIFEGMHRAQGG